MIYMMRKGSHIVAAHYMSQKEYVRIGFIIKKRHISISVLDKTDMDNIGTKMAFRKDEG